MPPGPPPSLEEGSDDQIGILPCVARLTKARHFAKMIATALPAPVLLALVRSCGCYYPAAWSRIIP